MSKAMEIFNEFRELFGNYLINNVAESVNQNYLKVRLSSRIEPLMKTF